MSNLIKQNIAQILMLFTVNRSLYDVLFTFIKL